MLGAWEQPQFYSKQSFTLWHHITSSNAFAHFQRPFTATWRQVAAALPKSRVHQGGSLGRSPDASLGLAFSFYGILFSARAISVTYFARAVTSCDTSSASKLTSCDSLPSCTILAILSTKPITIRTISTEVVIICNNLQKEIHNSKIWHLCFATSEYKILLHRLIHPSARKSVAQGLMERETVEREIWDYK